MANFWGRFVHGETREDAAEANDYSIGNFGPLSGSSGRTMAAKKLAAAIGIC